MSHHHVKFATPVGCCESFELPQSGDELTGKCGCEFGSQRLGKADAEEPLETRVASGYSTSASHRHSWRLLAGILGELRPLEGHWDNLCYWKWQHFCLGNRTPSFERHKCPKPEHALLTWSCSQGSRVTSASPVQMFQTPRGISNGPVDLKFGKASNRKFLIKVSVFAFCTAERSNPSLLSEALRVDQPLEAPVSLPV